MGEEILGSLIDVALPAVLGMSIGGVTVAAWILKHPQQLARSFAKKLRLLPGVQIERQIATLFVEFAHELNRQLGTDVEIVDPVIDTQDNKTNISLRIERMADPK